MIIVTGANGFIGSAFVWELNQQGITEITCVDTVDTKIRPGPLSNRKYSQFLLKDQIWDYLKSPDAQKVTWIIHMGANSSTTEKNWDHLLENNTMYSERLFQWCADNKKNLIYASSAATYGAGELGYDDTMDSNQLKPLNLYGESKVLMDRWAVAQKNTPPHWYGLKFFNVYGPNEYHKNDMASLVYKAYQQILTTGELKLFKSYKPEYKDGEQMRDFVYVKEVTGWMAELMKKTPASGIYNMGAGRARTWVDLAHAAFSSLKREDNVKFIEMPDNIKNQYQYFTESRMEKWLKNGMSPSKWSIEDGVKDYIQNYLTQQNPYL